jgi:hypothetical protein
MRPIYIWRMHNEIHQTLFDKGGGEGKWKCNEGSKFVQATLHVCMELLQ